MAGAGIAHIGVAIVAGLKARTHHTIATSGRRAIGQAGVGLDLIAVIAKLANLNHAITATCRLTVIAFVRRIVIAIVAAFARTEDAITATRFGAIAQTSVTFVLVPVIAGLEPVHASTQVGAPQGVAAARLLAGVGAGIVIAAIAIIALFVAADTKITASALLGDTRRTAGD